MALYSWKSDKRKARKTYYKSLESQQDFQDEVNVLYLEHRNVQ